MLTLAETIKYHKGWYFFGKRACMCLWSSVVKLWVIKKRKKKKYCMQEEMATHSTILAWKIPWTREPGRLLSTGSQRAGHNWTTVHTLTVHFLNWGGEKIPLFPVFHLFFATVANESVQITSKKFYHYANSREGNGNPLQYSCLERSMGSLRVGHNWATSLSLFTFMYWRRKRQPTPVFLPGESQGQRSLVGCCLWGRTESNTTEVT